MEVMEVMEAMEEENSGAAALSPLEVPRDDVTLTASSFTSHSTFSVWYSPDISVAGVVSLANSYALRFGLCGMAGVTYEGRGEALGDENGVERPKLEDMNPGGARGLTPSLGEPERGVGEPRHEAGDGRRKMACLIGGGDADMPEPSRYLHRASRTALSREVPVRAVFALKSSSSLSVLSSSSRLRSCRTGKHIS